MKNADQHQLELLYEQVVEGSNELLPEEKKFAEIVSKQAVLKLVESIKSRLYNRGKIDEESLGDLIGLPEEQFFTVFGSNEINKKVYEFFLTRDVYYDLIFTRKVKNLVYVLIRDAEEIVGRLSGDIKIIPFTQETELREAIQALIENSILVRYKDLLNTKIAAKSFMRDSLQWVEWRKEKLKYKEIENRLPEMQGLF